MGQIQLHPFLKCDQFHIRELQLCIFNHTFHFCLMVGICYLLMKRQSNQFLKIAEEVNLPTVSNST